MVTKTKKEKIEKEYFETGEIVECSDNGLDWTQVWFQGDLGPEFKYRYMCSRSVLYKANVGMAYMYIRKFK